jgi:hypothetical protein
VAPSALGAGRALPPLLFVTAPAALESRIGGGGFGRVRALLDAAGASLLSIDSDDPEEIAIAVAARLRGDEAITGVVIVGGHEVIPHWRVDTLDGTDSHDFADDPTDSDRFRVWSDDLYGFRTWPPPPAGDMALRLPEVAVSRIPDGASADAVLAALTAGGGRWAKRQFGVRNIDRPYAQAIYGRAFRLRKMLVSPPARASELPPYRVEGEHCYVALHGRIRDPQFYSDAAGGWLAALGSDNLGDPAPRVVLAAACWSGVTVDVRAVEADDYTAQSKGVADSFALACLARGTAAFLGCTGSHYAAASPLLAAGPLHSAIWHHLRSAPPALALLRARRDYVAAMPYSDDPLEQARELKMAAAFCCLGLGF